MLENLEKCLPISSDSEHALRSEAIESKTSELETINGVCYEVHPLLGDGACFYHGLFNSEVYNLETLKDLTKCGEIKDGRKLRSLMADITYDSYCSSQDKANDFPILTALESVNLFRNLKKTEADDLEKRRLCTDADSIRSASETTIKNYEKFNEQYQKKHHQDYPFLLYLMKTDFVDECMVSMLSVMAPYQQKNIHIIKRDAQNHSMTPQIISTANQEASLGDVYLRLKGNHYDLLKPTEDTIYI
jgi:hypothetical protein